MAVAARGFPAVHDRRRHSLTRNFWSTVVGNAGYAGCQWGMLIVLAKLCSPEAVGQFAVGFAVAAPVFMFTNLQLRAVLATDVKGENGFSAVSYTHLRAHETGRNLVCRLLLEKKKKNKK